MSFPPGEEDAGRGCGGRALLSEGPRGRLSAEEQAGPGPGRWIGPAGAPARAGPAGLGLKEAPALPPSLPPPAPAPGSGTN